MAVTVFSGFPAQALIEASRTADLIVIGSRGAGASSTCCSAPSSQVVHYAACPVVIVPSGR